jgi:ribosomal protein L7Ae-like RNA K-turn-binding protein
MVKTTIILDDELYKKLVQEALEKYGSTRKLSQLINEKLKNEAVKGVREGKRLRVSIGRDLKPEEIEKLVEEGWREIVKWKP